MSLRPLFAVMLILSAPGFASADLITNGGFTSNLNGWSQTSATTGSAPGSWNFSNSGTSLPSSGASGVAVMSMNDNTLEGGTYTLKLTQDFLLTGLNPGFFVSSATISWNQYLDLPGGAGQITNTPPVTQFVVTLADSTSDSVQLYLSPNNLPTPDTSLQTVSTPQLATFLNQLATNEQMHLTFTGTTSGTARLYAEIDNVSFNFTQSTPEPGSLILAGIGSGLFGWRSIRRRRSSAAA